MPRKTKIDKFVEFVETSLERKGFSLILVDDHSVEVGENMYSSGYFDYFDKVIKVATKRENDKWISVLAHEYSHFLQYTEQCDEWGSCHNGDMDINEYVVNWLEGDDTLHYRVICNYIDKIQKLELDCEKRTIKIIKQFKLPVKIKFYTKVACAYIHFHNCMTETRQWVKYGYKFSEDTELLNLIKPNFNQDFVNTPRYILDYMEKNCI